MQILKADEKCDKFIKFHEKITNGYFSR